MLVRSTRWIVAVIAALTAIAVGCSRPHPQPRTDRARVPITEDRSVVHAFDTDIEIRLLDRLELDHFLHDRDIHLHVVDGTVHDMPGSESPLLTIGPIVYVRLRGYGNKYGGSYPDQVLREWADWLMQAMSTGRDVYVYFNNDMNGFSVRDATRLRALVDKLAPQAPSVTGRSVATVTAGG